MGISIKILNRNSVLWSIFLIYLISISFLNIYWCNVLSPPEFIFILLGFCFIAQINDFNIIDYKLNYLDATIGLLIIIYGIGAMMSIDKNAIVEWVGLIYLVAFYIIVKWMILRDSDRTIRYLIYGLSIAGGITTILGIIGVIQAYGEHISNRFAWYYIDYPYFGNVTRARGLMGTPEMMAHVISISILLKLGYYKAKHFERWWWNIIILLEVIGLLLTSSKTIFILILILSLFIFIKKKNKGFRALFGMISALLFFIYIIGTHFVVRPKLDSSGESIWTKNFMNQTSISDVWELEKTNYFELKKLAIKVGLSQPLFGISGTSFNEYQKMNGLNNSNPSSINYDPHCTYLGAFAGYGFPGLVICCGLFILLIKIAARAYRKNPTTKHLLLFLIIIFLSIEGINTDILNFRLLWVVIALISVHAPTIKFSYSALTTRPNDHVV
ncbi:MAG: O-antigen ligase family protein [Saprospiraceae bacterium]|uniref:O-antigen ligase family protein n=1 Tax=Candidatus Defluviibacterium haderslevense TaxID=2981993 RepID=A0A9D7SBW6_9BACT|nr:O-antigen ligase family protein [Candidatus Defluviibacterium haderslevense]